MTSPGGATGLISDLAGFRFRLIIAGVAAQNAAPVFDAPTHSFREVPDAEQ